MEFTVARRFHKLILVSIWIWSSLTLWQKGQGQKLSKKNDHAQLFDPLLIPTRIYLTLSFFHFLLLIFHLTYFQEHQNPHFGFDCIRFLHKLP